MLFFPSLLALVEKKVKKKILLFPLERSETQVFYYTRERSFQFLCIFVARSIKEREYYSSVVRNGTNKLLL